MVALCAAATAAHLDAQRTIRWESAPLRRAGSGIDTLQLGRLEVPQFHGTATEPPLEIAFAVLPATTAHPGPPIVYLDGGPGGNGIEVLQVPAWNALFERLRAYGDVILLVQRGTSGTEPRPLCPLPRPIPTRLLGPREVRLDAQRADLAACAASWKQRGIDVRAFNTQESADDIEDLRVALGVAQIRIVGFSYGTHLGLAAMRRHPGSISQSVLVGVEGPNSTWKLPETMDRQLQHVSDLARRDSVVRSEIPDLFAATKELLARLDRRPITLDIDPGNTGTKVSVEVGGDGMRYLIRRDLGDTNDLPMLPALIATSLTGDYRLLQKLVERRYPGLIGRSLMAAATDCASAASTARLAEIDAQEPTSFLGASTNDWFPEVCDVIGVTPLGNAFRAPLISAIPTLFVSGTLDANTPPQQAFEVSWGWPNAAHLLVGDAGHESTLVPAVADAITAFIARGTLESAFVPGAAIRFVPPSRSIP